MFSQDKTNKNVNFFLAFLGSVTQTETSDACPGKCIHSLASLMCDEVKDDIKKHKRRGGGSKYKLL